MKPRGRAGGPQVPASVRLSNGAKVTFAESRGIGRFEARGLLTATVLVEAFGVIAERVNAAGLHAYVIRMDRALIAAPESALLVAEVLHATDRVPAALVVGDPSLGATLRHCRVMARRGFCRCAFSAVPPAQAWARMLAAVHRQWTRAAALERG